MLRQQASPPEVRLWRLLYPLRTGAYHFRKQVQIGPYCVDFACHHAKLVIEVGGDSHHLRGEQQKDAMRDLFLRREGYEILRFSNSEVLSNPEGVYLTIVSTLKSRPTSRRSVMRVME
jgi:very-short-patch-repair endonuclease